MQKSKVIYPVNPVVLTTGEVRFGIQRSFVFSGIVDEHPEIPNSPGPLEIENINRLCYLVLDPICVRFGAIYIISGYRCPELNRALGGSRTSAHMTGCAVDFVSVMGATIDEMMEFLKGSQVPFDQIIDEYRGEGEDESFNWLHASIAVEGKEPRGQAFIKRNGLLEIHQKPVLTQ
jgi:zinc D-Ala-D-Ala carboxypeptidase